MEIEALLAGPASPNRTQLHELLRAQRGRAHVHQHLVGLGDLLEQVTQGEVTWAAFVDAAKRELARVRVRRADVDQPKKSPLS